MLIYLLDTNVIRYITKTSDSDKQKSKEWFRKTKRFLDKVEEDIINGNADFRITDVTKSELAIQRFSIGEKKSLEVQSEINKHGSPLDTEYLNTAIINAAKEMIAYLVSTYNSKKDAYEMDYVFARGGTEDIEITCCAFDLEECVITTGNVKDFLIYVVLNNNNNVLYDIGAECYVKLPENLIRDIYNDEQFIELRDNWLNQMNNLAENELD